MSRLLSRVKEQKPVREFDAIEEKDSQKPQVLIAGMGRFGQIVARLLTAQHIPFVALEHSPEQVDDMRRFGNRIYYGDPTRPELLRAAGAQHVKACLLYTSTRPFDRDTALRIARAFLPKHPLGNRWDYYYTLAKLRSDPLYPGVLQALRGSDAPVLDLALIHI